MTNNFTPIAMVDDHVMIREALASLIESFGGYKIVIQASNGKDLLNKLVPENLPELLLLDIQMPEMNGIETAKVLSSRYPDLKILALSMMDDEHSVVSMVRNGARGYVLKDAEPAKLREAMQDVLLRGFHFSDMVTGRMIHTLQKNGDHHEPGDFRISERENEFLKHACSELTYKEIADRMHVSVRTVDGYRDALFEKLGVKSRVGLALYAVRNKIR